MTVKWTDLDLLLQGKKKFQQFCSEHSQQHIKCSINEGIMAQLSASLFCLNNDPGSLLHENLAESKRTKCHHKWMVIMDENIWSNGSHSKFCNKENQPNPLCKRMPEKRIIFLFLLHLILKSQFTQKMYTSFFFLGGLVYLIIYRPVLENEAANIFQHH